MANITRALIGCSIVLLMAAPRSGLPADITRVAWTASNLDVLRTFDRSAVEDLANRTRDDGMHAAVGEFAWMDLARDGRYQLVTRQDLSGRAFFDYLVVYWRSAAGKVTRDWIEGAALPPLGTIVRDLDDDGKDELVVPSAIDGDWRGLAAEPRVWPKVYRLRNGRYVDASAEYAAFYDHEVLPQLEQAIAQARGELRATPVEGPAHEAAERDLLVLELRRDKIGAILGRRIGTRWP